MRLVTFEAESASGRRRKTGAVSGGRIIDLAAARADQLHRVGTAAMASAMAIPTDMIALLDLGKPALEAAAEAVAHAEGRGENESQSKLSYSVDEVLLLAPLPRPPSLRNFMTVEAHVLRVFKDEPPEEWRNLPVYYNGNCDEIYGPDDTVPWPAFTEKLDFELQVCAVIGKSGRNVSPERADELIVGYTIYNDWSARDLQVREMSVGLGPSCSKDFASSIGPVIVTKDEFDAGAPMQVKVDGEVWSSTTLGTMQFAFPELICWISREQTLRPGDLLASGTVGNGCGVELDRWIPEGSVVELEVGGIGVLRNFVSARGAGPARASERPTDVRLALGLAVG
jgi:2-keto-4-pentenoate hydratase/2-oxohepta-3-ene-1,7-dioic acid hydratase in catechol pathway